MPCFHCRPFRFFSCCFFPSLPQVSSTQHSGAHHQGFFGLAVRPSRPTHPLLSDREHASPLGTHPQIHLAAHHLVGDRRSLVLAWPDSDRIPRPKIDVVSRHHSPSLVDGPHPTQQPRLVRLQPNLPTHPPSDPRPGRPHGASIPCLVPDRSSNTKSNSNSNGDHPELQWSFFWSGTIFDSTRLPPWTPFDQRSSGLLCAALVSPHNQGRLFASDPAPRGRLAAGVNKSAHSKYLRQSDRPRPLPCQHSLRFLHIQRQLELRRDSTSTP